MGPIIDCDLDQAELSHAILNLCKTEHISHLELSSQCLNAEVLRRAGFQVYRSSTYRVPLPKTVDQAWASIKSIGRNRIRKAERNGFTVEQVAASTFIDEFYAQFSAKFATCGELVPYSRERLQALCAHPVASRHLLALIVKYQGEAVATSYYLFDDRTMYLGDCASRLEWRGLCPNDLLHWTALKMGIERGISVFDGTSTNRFWEKFNAFEVPTYRFSKSFAPFLRLARNVYRYCLQKHTASVVLSSRSPFKAQEIIS